MEDLWSANKQRECRVCTGEPCCPVIEGSTKYLRHSGPELLYTLLPMFNSTFGACKSTHFMKMWPERRWRARGRRQPVTFWFESAEGDRRGLLSLGRLLLLLPFGFKQICLFVEVWPAVGSSAGKAAAFNCSLLWRVGGIGRSAVALAHNGA